MERALAKGYAVTALVRDAEKLEHRDQIRVLTGDATNEGDVQRALEGADAVIDTIGGTTPYKDTVLERTAAHNVLQGMRATGVRRLIVVSMMGLGTSKDQAPFWYEHLLMPTFLRGSTKDKAAMEQEVTESGLDFVIVRPPLLKDDPAKGNVTVLLQEGTGHEITRADLAQFLADQVENHEFVGRAVTVVNR